MMSAVSRREVQEFLDILEDIKDEKVRYFFFMLGAAIGASDAAVRVAAAAKANTSSAHIEELAQRLNTQS
jgi:hypothetical protein